MPLGAPGSLARHFPFGRIVPAMKKVLALALLTFAPLPAALAKTTATSALAGPSQQDQNKAIARRVFDEIFNEGKFEVADEIYAKDFLNHGLHRDADLQEDQAAVHWEKKAFLNLTITVDFMMAEADLVTVVWTARGTNTGRAGALPPTGFKLEERGITIWRIVNGKITEEWTSFDELGIARQFVGQLRWELIGLLAAVIVLIWIAASFIRKRRLIHTIPAAKSAS